MADETLERGLELLRENPRMPVTTAARNAGCARSTLQEHWLREKKGDPIGRESVTVDGPLPSSWTMEEIMREHGLDPEEYVFKQGRANRYGPPEKPNHQFRFDFFPKESLIEIEPPDPHKWKAPKPRKATKAKPLKAVVISDHHAPHHEKTFHELFLAYLTDEQPDVIDVNGDLLDFSTISRHKERETFTSPVNDCLQAGYEILADYRSICPEATIRYKRGNHSERLRAYLMDNARALHNITAAGEELPALSLQRLLRLDELKVEYVDVEWEQAVTKLSQKLRVRHGFSTAKNAGVAILDRLSGSTVQGHDHRAWMAHRTEHEDGDIRVRMAMSTGCACEIPGGLGYSVDPDWANAFGAFEIYPDGDFHASLGMYVPGRLLAPNGRRYQTQETRQSKRSNAR